MVIFLDYWIMNEAGIIIFEIFRDSPYYLTAMDIGVYTIFNKKRKYCSIYKFNEHYFILRKVGEMAFITRIYSAGDTKEPIKRVKNLLFISSKKFLEIYPVALRKRIGPYIDCYDIFKFYLAPLLFAYENAMEKLIKTINREHLANKIDQLWRPNKKLMKIGM